MKVAHVHADLPPDTHGGVAWQVHRLACAQVRVGHDVTVFTFSEKPADAPYAVTRLAGRAKGLARLFLTGLAFARADYSGFDVVHFHGDSYLASPRAPVVRTFYGSAISEMWHATSWRFRVSQALVYPMELVAMLRADRTVGISAATSHALPGVRTLIPCGVDTAVFHPGGARSERPSILFVGTLSGRKRGALLVRAFADEVRRQVPDAELWIVGPETVEAPGVKALGRLPEEALADAYRRAWVFCLPSSYEGFGVPYVEAMASGTPVVATTNPGAREVTDSGTAGVLTDDARLGTALVSLLTDDARRDALSRAGRERASTYDWSRVVALYDRIYAEVT